MNAPESVIVIADCPTCPSTKALMAVALSGQTPFACLECEETWWAEVIEPETCSTGFGGGASCGLPMGHDEPCAVAS